MVMTPHTYIPIHAGAALATLACGVATAKPAQEYLWYRQPALVATTPLPWGDGSAAAANVKGKPNKDPWESQTLPIGNGRIGGTIYGGDHLERVILNEVSLWSGGPNLPGNGSGYEYGPLAKENAFGCYQPFGELDIEFALPGKVEGYTRTLNLKNATAGVAFTCKGVKHTREAFVSGPDNVLVYTAKADRPGAVSAKIGLLPCHTATYSVSGNTISYHGTLANGERFAASMLVRAKGGSCSASGDGGASGQVSYKNNDPKSADSAAPVYPAQGLPYIHVEGADSVEILISLATDYEMNPAKNWRSGKDPAKNNEKILSKAAAKDYADLRKAHIADYQRLYNRLGIHLGKTPGKVAQLPTDERLQHYRKKGKPDPELEATVYQYGRYVLISGSRPGNLPVNLQGIWNNKVHAAWASDYHNNINLQMCYWGAEVGNLPECHMPLINFIDVMQGPLHEMTQKEFGADTPGWTTRISQNPWGGGGWTKWNPPVNAWYALHVWEHYLYTQDKEYLRKTAYPILKNICRFWEHQLKEVGDNGEGLESDGKPLSVKDHPELARIKKGTLVSPKGWSHEWGPVEDGCAHDQQLIRELFSNTVKAAAILKTDAEWAKGLAEKRDRLAGDCVAKGGYLMEWIVDRPDKVSGHRHTSHLIGVFPGCSISPAKTPDIAKAAMKSLELRGLSADNRRSWTWPWRTALWARFGKQDKAYDMVQNYLRYNVLDNLFGNHPPMQMDGVYGMTAGMSEMLLQSHAGKIELLPALPPAWKNGSVKGIRARGDITVDMAWKDGKVTSYSLTSSNPKPVKVKVNGKTTKVTPNAPARHD